MRRRLSVHEIRSRRLPAAIPETTRDHTIDELRTELGELLQGKPCRFATTHPQQRIEQIADALKRLEASNEA